MVWPTPEHTNLQNTFQDLNRLSVDTLALLSYVQFHLGEIVQGSLSPSHPSSCPARLVASDSHLCECTGRDVGTLTWLFSLMTRDRYWPQAHRKDFKTLSGP